jgi:hypothetical protein
MLMVIDQRRRISWTGTMWSTRPVAAALSGIPLIACESNSA